MKVIYKKLRGNAILPRKGTEYSAGYDVYAAKVDKVSDNEVVVYLGFSMQPEDHNWEIQFRPRSSFTKYEWLIQNSPTTGDSDFPGEYRIRFKAIPVNIRNNNLQYEPFPYKEGDRVAQMFVKEVEPINFEEGELPHSTDRKGGFGHTGK